MVEIKKILCAVDFSELSAQIADYAKTLAKPFGAEIHILYIAPTLAQYVGLQVAPTSIENFVNEIIAGAENTMEKFLQDNLSEVNAQGHVFPGYAAEEILNFANNEQIDMIIMGTHGRKGIDRILFGSVAEKVVKAANVPVLTLRPTSTYSENK